MSRNTIIGLIIGGVIILGGAGAYLLLSNDSSDSNTDETTSTNEQESNNSSPTFNPLATGTESFTAAMEGTTAEGETYTATIESDGQGNSHYYGTFSGEQTFEVYYIGGKTIFCSEGTCFENPTASATTPVSSDQYEYSSEDLNDYRQNATYKGKQPCPAGSCDTWEITREGYTGTMSVDSQGRISRASWTGAEGNFAIDYTYENVSIDAPENVQAFPGLQQ